MKRISVPLTEQQLKELEAVKKMSGASMNEIVRRALDYYFHHLRQSGSLPILPTVPAQDQANVEAP